MKLDRRMAIGFAVCIALAAGVYFILPKTKPPVAPPVRSVPVTPREVDDWWQLRGAAVKAEVAEREWNAVREQVGEALFEKLPPDAQAEPFVGLRDKYFGEGILDRSHRASLKALELTSKPPEEFDIYIGALAKDAPWLEALLAKPPQTKGSKAYLEAALWWAQDKKDAILELHPELPELGEMPGHDFDLGWGWVAFLQMKVLAEKGDYAKAADMADSLSTCFPAMGSASNDRYFLAMELFRVLVRGGHLEVAQVMYPMLNKWFGLMDTSWSSTKEELAALGKEYDLKKVRPGRGAPGWPGTWVKPEWARDKTPDLTTDPPVHNP
jgi:hypothetical protein